jgi:hypothetical protein
MRASDSMLISLGHAAAERGFHIVALEREWRIITLTAPA